MESHTAVAVAPREAAGPSIFARHQFLIKRLFSLTGLFFSGYVVVHLLTNASVLAGPAMFQEGVNRIHSLGPILPLVEWVFLFLPIIFHSIVGWGIILGASPNLGDYRYSGNVRYTLQRVTAIILFFFILGHVLHMHQLGAMFGGGLFKPEQASSSMASALQSALWIQLFYALGVFSAAFHVGNGIWTAGITWGLWTSAAAQRRANKIAVALGLLVMLLGVLAIIGARRVNVSEARQIEERMEIEHRKLRGELVPAEPAASAAAPE